MQEKPRVLFLDATNSDRSQIAEALLRLRAGEVFEVCSAGLMPQPIREDTHQVLREVGVNPEGLRPKSVSEFLARVPVRYGITLGQRGEPHAPRIYPFAALPLNDVATAPPTPAPQPPTKEGLLAAYLSGCVKRPDATIRTCNCEVAHLQAYSLNQMLAFLDAHDDRPLDAVKVMCAYETRNAF